MATGEEKRVVKLILKQPLLQDLKAIGPFLTGIFLKKSDKTSSFLESKEGKKLVSVVKKLEAGEGMGVEELDSEEELDCGE